MIQIIHRSAFRRTSFAHGTSFSKCRFEKCRFERQHTYLGGPSRFENCEFLECRFENVQLWQAEFVGCRFTGEIRNLVLYGPDAAEDLRTVLRDVDFSGVSMEFMSFRMGIDLSTTKLPKEGWDLQ